MGVGDKGTLIGANVRLDRGLNISGKAELKSGYYVDVNPEGASPEITCYDVRAEDFELPVNGKVTLYGGHYDDLDNEVSANLELNRLTSSLGEGRCYADKDNYWFDWWTPPNGLENVWVMIHPTYTEPKAHEDWTFDDQTRPLAENGSDVLYFLGEKNAAPGDDAAWTTVVPTGKDAGEYYVWWRVKPDIANNIAGVRGGVLPVLVSPAQAQVKTAPVAIEGLEYDGKDHPLVTAGVEVKAPGCEMQYSLTNEEGSYSPEIPTGKKAGNYTVWYRAAGNEANKDNYTPSEPESVQVTITTDVLRIVTEPVPETNLIWSGRSQQLLKSAGESNGGTVMYAQSLVDVEPADGSAWREDYTWVTGVSVRTYYVWYKVKGFDGYADVPAVCIPVTIQVAVAESGGVYYTTLEEAIENGNGTVNLLSSPDSAVETKIDKSVTLNNDSGYCIVNGTLTVVQGGELTVDGKMFLDNVTVQSGGTLTVRNGNIGTLNADGGTVTVTDGGISALNVNGGSVTLSGGSYGSITVSGDMTLLDLLDNDHGYGYFMSYSTGGELLEPSSPYLNSTGKTLENVVVKQTGYEAQIGLVYYGSFANAMAAAQNMPSATVMILQKETKAAEVIMTGGNITITGEGTVKGDLHVQGGRLTVQSGTIERLHIDGGAGDAAITNGVHIGTLQVNDGGHMAVAGGSIGTLNIDNGSTVDITGGEVGEVHTWNDNRWYYKYSTLNISGGEITNMDIVAAEVNVRDGANITGNVHLRENGTVWNGRSWLNVSGGDLGDVTIEGACFANISGGHFRCLYNSYSHGRYVNFDVKLTGGTFDGLKVYAYYYQGPGELEPLLLGMVQDGYGYFQSGDPNAGVDVWGWNVMQRDWYYDWPHWVISDVWIANVTVHEIRDASVTQAPAGVTGLTYTGENQALVTPGAAYHGWMAYAVTQSDPGTPPDPSAFSGDVPTAQDAGTYYVWWMAKGDFNWRDSEISEGCITVTITEGDPDVTPPTAAYYTYDGSEHQLLTSGGSAKHGTVQYALGTDGVTAPTGGWTDDYAGFKADEAGTYYVWYRVVGDDNYGNGAWCLAVTIGKADVGEVTAPELAEGLYYQNIDQALIVTPGSAEHGTVMYAVTDTAAVPAAGAAWTDDAAQITGHDAGTYYVWYKADGGANYKSTEPARAGSIVIRDAEANIGEKYYLTFEEAAEAANESGGEITVRRNVTLDEAVEITAGVTLRSDSPVNVIGAGFKVTGSLTVNDYVTVYGVSAGGVAVAMDMTGSVTVAPADGGGVTVTFGGSEYNGLRVGDTTVSGELGDTVTVDTDGCVVVPLGPAPNNVMIIDGKTFTNTGSEPVEVKIYQDGSVEKPDTVTMVVEPPADGLRLAPGESLTYEAGSGKVTVTGGYIGATLDVAADGSITATKGNVTVRGEVAVTENGGRANQLGDMTVTVMDNGGTLIDGTRVTLTAVTEDGAKTVSATTKDGRAAFKDLSYGVYTVQIVYTLNGIKLTMTDSLTVSHVTDEQIFIFDEVLVSTAVDGDRLPAVDNLADAISEDEKQTAGGGDGPLTAIDITLKSDKIEEGKESKEQLTAVNAIQKQIDEELSGADGTVKHTVTDLVDVTITKTTSTYSANGDITKAPPEKVPETAGLLTLRFPISAAMRGELAGYAGSEQEHVFVYRYHDKAAERMKRVSAAVGAYAGYECYYLDGNYLVIRAQRFSVYAFGVSNEPVEEYVEDYGGYIPSTPSTPSPSPTPTPGPGGEPAPGPGGDEPTPTPTPTPGPGGDEPTVPVEPPKTNGGTGWSYDYGTGEWYFFKKGELVANYWVGKIDGASQWDKNWYYVGPDGKMLTGMQYLDDLHGGYGWYFLQPNDAKGEIGKMLTGYQWVGGEYGECWFETKSGSAGKCTWSELLGSWNSATGLWADGLSHKK